MTALLERVRVETLAETLAALRRKADLSRRQLEAVSGVSEETIKAIETRHTRPTPDTLRKIAVGLATNRALGKVDPAAVDEMQATLMEAAHYVPRATLTGSAPPPPADPDEDALFRRLIEQRTGNRASAELIARFAERARGRQVSDVETIAAVLDVLLGPPRPSTEQ